MASVDCIRGVCMLHLMEFRERHRCDCVVDHWTEQKDGDGVDGADVVVQKLHIPA